MLFVSSPPTCSTTTRRAAFPSLPALRLGAGLRRCLLVPAEGAAWQRLEQAPAKGRRWPLDGDRRWGGDPQLATPWVLEAGRGETPGCCLGEQRVEGRMGMLPGEGSGCMEVSRPLGMQPAGLGTSLKVLGDRFGQPLGKPIPWGRWGKMQS